jgi:hypothetical protein
MGKHFKQKPQRPVPGTRKPLTRAIQPKDIGTLVAKQKQPDPTAQQRLQHLVSLRRDFQSGPVADYLDAQIRKLEAEVELEQGLMPKRGSR